MDGIINDWRVHQRRRGLAAATIIRRAEMVTTFCHWTGNALLAATAEDVETFLDGRRTATGDPIGAKTRYTWLSALGCFYKWAIRVGVALANPIEAIDRPKVPCGLPRPISDADLALARAGAPSQTRAWFTLAAYAGLRCAEIAGLRRDDVLTDVNRLHVLGKGHKERLVPMSPLVAEALAAQPTPAGKNGYLFTRPSNGTRWTAGCVSRVGGEQLRDLGIDATMHQLRHWFGTSTLRACGNLRTVQYLMGHSDPKTTAIYAAFCDEEAEAAVLALVA